MYKVLFDWKRSMRLLCRCIEIITPSGWIKKETYLLWTQTSPLPLQRGGEARITAENTSWFFGGKVILPKEKWMEDERKYSHQSSRGKSGRKYEDNTDLYALYMISPNCPEID